MMYKYTKRPMDVMAERWVEGEPMPEHVKYDEATNSYYVISGEGKWQVKPGDWVVQGQSGTIYAVQHPDFLRIYEPA
jgi:mannose-6-phosphate isomerase-like protein (cupin superfamily)